MLADVLTVTCIANSLLALTSMRLFWTCSRRRHALTSVVDGEDWNHDVLQSLRQMLLDLSEPSWSQCGQYAPLERIVPRVEEADCEQTIRALLEDIASDCTSTFDGKIKIANLEQFTKSVYRLQKEFYLPDAAMADILSVAADRIQGSSILSKKVDRVEFVKTGARVDEKTMWPLNQGLRVKQPFGLILRTESGEILSRAKARCS